jgi:uncharacterized membrane protein (UPF0127 family)
LTASAPVAVAKRRYVTLRRNDGAVVCERCFVADRALPRMKGLLGRRELPAGEGILIKPANSIHMFFMRFSIDAIFLNRDNTVVKVAANLNPWRTAGARRARSVVELAAGEAGRRGVSVGDHIEIDTNTEAT